MTFSLNEVEATVRKAARGAGLPIGIAEDIGRAAAWLCARGEDGSAAALEGLRRYDASRPCALNEAGADPAARAVIEGLSAIDLIIAGCRDRVELSGLDVPMLLRGLVGISTAGRELAIELDLGLDGHATLIRREWHAAESAPHTRRHEADPAVWHELQGLAARTYVPASEASRAHGAGAGLVDRD